MDKRNMFSQIFFVETLEKLKNVIWRIPLKLEKLRKILVMTLFCFISGHVTATTFP